MIRPIKDEPYRMLAAAIVEQAVEDYITALEMEKRELHPKEYGQTVPVLENFFKSQYFEALANVDGAYLSDRIRSMVYNARKEN